MPVGTSTKPGQSNKEGGGAGDEVRSETREGLLLHFIPQDQGGIVRPASQIMLLHPRSAHASRGTRVDDFPDHGRLGRRGVGLGRLVGRQRHGGQFGVELGPEIVEILAEAVDEAEVLTGVGAPLWRRCCVLPEADRFQVPDFPRQAVVTLLQAVLELGVLGHGVVVLP